MTDPTAHWSPSEVDDDDDRASYPPPPALDLDAMHAALWSPTCSQCGAVDPPTEPAEYGDGGAFNRHVGCPSPDPLFASSVGIRGITRAEQRALLAEAQRLRASLAATEAESRVALDALHARCDAAEAEVGRLRAEVAAAQPVLMLDAAAGESFAAEHPYAAGAIMGGIAHRSEVSK